VSLGSTSWQMSPTSVPEYPWGASKATNLSKVVPFEAQILRHVLMRRGAIRMSQHRAVTGNQIPDLLRFIVNR
jgi:hypothetical protein